MRDLSFSVTGARAVEHAASPQVALALRVECARPDDAVHSALLQCQAQIDPTRRPHSPAEQARLADLFGEPSRWASTARSLLWSHVTLSAPSFTGAAELELLLPCAYELADAASRYAYALEGGEVPLSLFFSGTVFYPGEDGALQVSQVRRSREARFNLSRGVLEDLARIYYPERAPLALRRDVIDRLCAYKSREGLATLDAAVERLLSLSGPA